MTHYDSTRLKTMLRISMQQMREAIRNTIITKTFDSGVLRENAQTNLKEKRSAEVIVRQHGKEKYKNKVVMMKTNAGMNDTKQTQIYDAEKNEYVNRNRKYKCICKIPED